MSEDAAKEKVLNIAGYNPRLVLTPTGIYNPKIDEIECSQWKHDYKKIDAVPMTIDKEATQHSVSINGIEKVYYDNNNNCLRLKIRQSLVALLIDKNAPKPLFPFSGPPQPEM